ncbi:hypothetical protein [Kineococcus sp. SYSU DK004]|uniref:hypothetical protein n=1 Tax=Kineococcus sp. SYSU DK004 TaxID=3383125 RepID=UPI003D7E232A
MSGVADERDDPAGEDPAAQDRRAELLGAAAVGDLSPAEARELDALAAADPSVAEELRAHREVLAALPPRGSGWDEPVPPPGPVLPGGATGAGPAAAPAGALHRRRTASRWVGAAAAVVVGAGIGAGAVTVGREVADRPVQGPPGTLGAVEELVVLGEPEGVRADVALVAHTWGTETVLDVAGLPAGREYAVVLVRGDGAEAGSGSFLGSRVPVECRLNAAVLREDVAAVEVRDEDGALVLRSEAPAVAG